MRFVFVLSIAVLLGFARQGAAQNVTYDFDKSATFPNFKTYLWVPAKDVKDELNHQRVIDAIEKQMAAKGLVKAQPNSGPDVLLQYNVRFEKSLQVTGFSSAWGGYRLVGSRSGSARAEEIVVGSLIVELRDATNNRVIWRGIATRDIDPGASPEKREKNINKSVEKIFKNYPPKQ